MLRAGGGVRARGALERGGRQVAGGRSDASSSPIRARLAILVALIRFSLGHRGGTVLPVAVGAAIGRLETIVLF